MLVWRCLLFTVLPSLFNSGTRCKCKDLFFSQRRASTLSVKHGWWDTGARRTRREEAKHGQAGSRDKAIALHCQSGEAINNSVTIKRERGREWRSESRVYKRNTTKPGATGASSCWALMGVRSGWLSILCLMAHSSADVPWHPWRSATHLFNPVCTLEGDTMVEVERWRVREREGKSKVKLNLDLSKCSVSLSSPCTFSQHLPSLPAALAAPLHYCHHNKCHGGGLQYFPSSAQHSLPLEVRR